MLIKKQYLPCLPVGFHLETVAVSIYVFLKLDSFNKRALTSIARPIPKRPPDVIGYKSSNKL